MTNKFINVTDVEQPTYATGEEEKPIRYTSGGYCRKCLEEFKVKQREFKALTDAELEEVKQLAADLKAQMDEEKRLNPPVPQMLTRSELQVIRSLGDVNSHFNRLEEHHSSDVEDFTYQIHLLQRQVMSRAARRGYPNVFNEMEENKDIGWTSKVTCP